MEFKNSLAAALFLGTSTEDVAPEFL